MVSLTRAILRLAELGFLGFAMTTWLMTPFLCVLPSRSGDLEAFPRFLYFLRVAWFSVAAAGSVGWKAREKRKDRAGRAG